MKRYAIFGLIDHSTAELIRTYQQVLSVCTGDSLALRFPIHVTLRGPFWANSNGIHSLLYQTKKSTAAFHQLDVLLVGPVPVSPSLCWLELTASGSALQYMSGLHTMLEGLVAPLMLRDDVPDEHKGANFRPHVTLGWGVSPAALCDNLFNAGPLKLHGIIESIAIVGYPEKWPEEGSVEVLGRSNLAREGEATLDILH
ncbi:2'-5' RNA ligase family protein [Desulfoferrobacter suflitae]|uniref:2'-5' RNA ligase family protein n=1 Tax=Desulfoferrobacter suflitae TaxID=2865782 RepID=UPI003EBAEABB